MHIRYDQVRQILGIVKSLGSHGGPLIVIHKCRHARRTRASNAMDGRLKLSVQLGFRQSLPE